MKKFSVITPVYNGEKFIEECVEHIRKMSYDINLIEHIIIDDGSKDNTAQICQKLAEKYHHIKFYSKPNGNWGSAINFVKQNNLVHNDYVVICDADDYLDNDAFNLVNQKSNDSDIIVGSYRVFSDIKVGQKFSNYYYLFKNQIYSNTNLTQYYAPAIVPTCIYFKKDIFYKTCNLSENVMYQDVILFADCFSKAQSLKVLKTVISYYRKNQNDNSMAQRLTPKGINSANIRFDHWVKTGAVENMAYDIMFSTKTIRKQMIEQGQRFVFKRKPTFKVFPFWMRPFIWLIYKINCNKIITISKE